MVVFVKRFRLCFRFLKSAMRIKLVAFSFSGFTVCIAGLVIHDCFIVFRVFAVDATFMVHALRRFQE